MPALAVLASLSPLLTLAALWQVKEWRWDRLLEHLRREGWVGQVAGKFRPVIVGGYLLGQVIRWADGRMGNDGMIAGTLIVLLLLNVMQVLLQKQRQPVWTRKAMMLVATATTLTGLLALFLHTHHPLALPLVVLLQPLTLMCAWALWYPIDSFLKRRIITQARRAREAHPNLTVIGVTGSVGKTTTKELLACVLKDLQPAVTPAHVNTEIGVAQWLATQFRVTSCELRELLDPQPETRNPQLLIIEMGAYRKGEIETLCSFTQPTLGVVTHVGTQHIALFRSQENLFAAKSELVRALPEDGRAFLNGDNELCRKMVDLSPCPVTIVGTGGSCDLEAFDIEETPRGIRFTARGAVFEVPLHGTHNVSNVLLAIAVGEHQGVSFERMRELLGRFTPLSKTFAVREEAGIRILDDTHNSSVASLKAVIAWARTQPEEHKILLAAGLIEMGELQSPAEQELAAFAVTVFNRIIVIDPQSARNFAAGAGKNVEVFSSHVAKIPTGSLLVCAGRMSAAAIRTILP